MVQQLRELVEEDVGSIPSTQWLRTICKLRSFPLVPVGRSTIVVQRHTRWQNSHTHKIKKIIKPRGSRRKMIKKMMTQKMTTAERRLP